MSAMLPAVAKTVHRTAVGSAIIGAVLSPIPLLDELILFPVYGGLAARIGSAHGLRFGDVPWKPLLRTAFNGLVARAGFDLAVAYIPGVAAVANAASAAALTEAYGRFADGACANPAQARAVGVKEIAVMLKDTVTSFRKAPA